MPRRQPEKPPEPGRLNQRISVTLDTETFASLERRRKENRLGSLSAAVRDAVLAADRAEGKGGG